MYCQRACLSQGDAFGSESQTVRKVPGLTAVEIRGTQNHFIVSADLDAAGLTVVIFSNITGLVLSIGKNK